MSERQIIEKIGILFNRMQGKNLDFIHWDINPDKGVVVANDNDGNTFKITIEPQAEVTI